MSEKLEISLRLQEFIKKYFANNAASLARAMGISEQVLDKYTSGHTNIGHVQLLRLINLGCNINWLLTGVGEPFLEKNSVVKEKIEPAYSAGMLELKKQIQEIKADMYDLQKENKEMKLLLGALLQDNISLENKNLILSVLHYKIDDKDENVSVGKLH